MRIVILAPIRSSIYARLVSWYLAQDSRFVLTDVIVKSPWNRKRIKSEFRRDGVRLLKKVSEKMVMGDARFNETESDTILSKARKAKLPEGSLKKLALKLNYQFSIVDDHNNLRCQKIIENAQPDTIVFTGGGMIRPNILAIPKSGILNCHLGILPKYRGMDVVEWPAVENALDKEGIGLTLHFMDKGLDTGAILIKKNLQLRKSDTFESIRIRLESMMADHVYEGLKLLVNNEIKAHEQFLEDGRQYFVMHPRMQNYAKAQLQTFLTKL